MISALLGVCYLFYRGPDAFLIFRFPIILLISFRDIAVINKLFSSGEITGIFFFFFFLTLKHIFKIILHGGIPGGMLTIKLIEYKRFIYN